MLFYILAYNLTQNGTTKIVDSVPESLFLTFFVLVMLIYKNNLLKKLYSYQTKGHLLK